ncbi:hypothetical protein TNCV_4550411 [Trichonephila clavipes]|nr:hypothetical protein TNCV_4550411 [Trichonephila clavipes]
MCHKFETSTAEDPRYRVGRCKLNVEIHTSSRWCSVEVRREVYHLRCRPRHLTMVQNDEVCLQKSSNS